jgi:hypothetical protein
MIIRLLAQYPLVVLTSFGQVADTLHALDHDAQALQTHETQLASAKRTVELTQQGYRVGNAGILQVVTAEGSSSWRRSVWRGREPGAWPILLACSWHRERVRNSCR